MLLSIGAGEPAADPQAATTAILERGLWSRLQWSCARHDAWQHGGKAWPGEKTALLLAVGNAALRLDGVCLNKQWLEGWHAGSRLSSQAGLNVSGMNWCAMVAWTLDTVAHLVLYVCDLAAVL